VIPPNSAGSSVPAASTGDAPTVTIVIIGHSVKHELGICLASIENHADVPVEVIYVDNASDDGTGDWLRAGHPEVEVIELPENVWDSARNPGLSRARGRYTMFLDSDTSLTPGALPAMVTAMDEHPDWGLMGPRLANEDGSLQLSTRRFPSPLLPLWRRPPLSRFMEDSGAVRQHLMEDQDHDLVRGVVYVIGACQFFRTDLGREFGGMDVAIGKGGAADVDWCLRFWKAERPVVYFPRATVEHRYRRTSAKTPFSRHAMRHLWSFALLQWEYRGEQRALRRLADRLDREGALL
jgi:N-acetylglucosaminyl-diphospho-decaprenol L-rhamnosyltransferase